MPTTKILTAAGKDGDTVELADALFAAPVNETLIHQAVVRQLAARRVGTSDTLTRGQVAGGGKKPWRQKGTGRARQGTRTAPHWKGGGVVFGPHPRDYEMKMNAKMRRAALHGVLSAKSADGALRVVAGFDLAEIGTKEFLGRLGGWKAEGKVLLVLAGSRRDRRALGPQPAGSPRDPRRQPERRRPARAPTRSSSPGTRSLGSRRCTRELHERARHPAAAGGEREERRSRPSATTTRSRSHAMRTSSRSRPRSRAEFKVDVLGVRVLSVKPKQKRRGRKTLGMVPGWRKAIVTIAAGQKIELFEAV